MSLVTVFRKGEEIYIASCLHTETQGGLQEIKHNIKEIKIKNNKITPHTTTSWQKHGHTSHLMGSISLWVPQSCRQNHKFILLNQFMEVDIR